MKNFLFFAIFLIAQITFADNSNPENTVDKPISVLVMKPALLNGVNPDFQGLIKNGIEYMLSDLNYFALSESIPEVELSYTSNPVAIFYTAEQQKNLISNKTYFLGESLIRPYNEEIVVVWFNLVDVRTGRIVFSTFKSMPRQIGFASQVGDFTTLIEDGLKEIGQEKLALDPPAHIPSPVPKIILQSTQEGVEVCLPDGTYIGKIINGKLVYTAPPLVSGGYISLLLKKPGFLSTQKDFLVLNADIPINLGDINPIVKERLEIAWNASYITSVGIFYQTFIDPDWQYLSLGGNLTIKTIESYSVQNGTTTILRILPELSFGYGTYVFTPPENFIRLAFEARIGFLAGFVTTKDSVISTDFYLQPSIIKLEFNFTDFILVADIAYRFYLGVFDNSLFGYGFPDDKTRYGLSVIFKLPGGSHETP